MKQGTPHEPMITYDHRSKERAAKDPGFRLAGRLLLIAECTLLVVLLVAMIRLY
jgi:hypothetical protein